MKCGWIIRYFKYNFRHANIGQRVDDFVQCYSCDSLSRRLPDISTCHACIAAPILSFSFRSIFSPWHTLIDPVLVPSPRGPPRPGLRAGLSAPHERSFSHVHARRLLYGIIKHLLRLVRSCLRVCLTSCQTFRFTLPTTASRERTIQRTPACVRFPLVISLHSDDRASAGNRDRVTVKDVTRTRDVPQAGKYIFSYSPRCRAVRPLIIAITEVRWRTLCNLRILFRLMPALGMSDRDAADKSCRALYTDDAGCARIIYRKTIRALNIMNFGYSGMYRS